jgi:Plasmid pRiA4b ORF-3-like protein
LRHYLYLRLSIQYRKKMTLHFSEQPILKDFDRFITYLCDHPNLLLTNDKVVLKGNDALALNEQMTSYQTTFVTSRFPQRAYSLVNSFFYIAQVADFFFVNSHPKNGKNTIAIREERIREYDALTDDEKYFFLLETFWCHIDWDEAYDCRAFWSHDFYKKLATKPVNRKITLGEREFKRKGEMEAPNFYFVAEIFKAFGFFDMTWDETLTSRPTKYACPYKDMTLLPLGEIMLSVLMSERPQYVWQRQDNMDLSFLFREYDNEEEDDDDRRKGNFEDAFLPFFEGLTIKKRLVEFPKTIDERECVSGCYYLKASLDKKTYRTILIGGNDTFDDLHDAIQDAFDFDDDHLYAFFMDGKPWSRTGESYWSPMNDDGLMADEVKIGSAGLFEGKKFLYLFDFGDEWQFNIQVLSIKTDEKEPKKIETIESVGENPSQYRDEDDEDYDD